MIGARLCAKHQPQGVAFVSLGKAAALPYRVKRGRAALLRCHCNSMKSKPKTIDEYLATASVEQRIVLEKLRRTIHMAAQGAEEYIGYGLAGFKFNRRPLVYFGAWEKHCALYAASPSVQKKFQKELKGFEVSKGTIRFTTEKPLSTALVKKLIKARIAENEARAKAK